MAPKAKLTTPPDNFQLEIRADIKEVKTYVKLNSLNIRDLDRRLVRLSDDVKSLHQRFDRQEQTFEKWRSEIHNLIDSGFTSKAKRLDDEVDILNVRTVDLRHRTEKLEKVVFTPST